MKKTSVLAGVAAAVMAGNAGPALAETLQTDLDAYSINRIGGTPPNTTNLPLVRDSTGDAKFKVNRRQRTVDYTVNFNGIQSGVIMAHIHLGNEWQNGPIMVWLCDTPGAPAPATAPRPPACPEGTPDGTIRGRFDAASVLGPGGEQISPGDFDTLMDLVDAGAAYVLVHSNEFRPGEIRGQFKDRR